MLIYVDIDGTIRQINNSTKSFLNLKKEEILHNSNHILFHDKNLKESECQVCKAIKNGLELNSHEVHMDQYTYSFTVSPMYLGSELTGAIQVCTDLSKRKHAETELRKSQQYLEAIFKNEPECVKVVDPSGVLLDMNPAGLEMLQADTLDEALADTDSLADGLKDAEPLTLALAEADALALADADADGDSP